MTPALIMLVVPGLPSYNGAEVYYLKGVIGLPIVISFRDRWYTHIFFWKWAHWWRHRHRLDRFIFQNFQSPAHKVLVPKHVCQPLYSKSNTSCSCVCYYIAINITYYLFFFFSKHDKHWDVQMHGVNMVTWLITNENLKETFTNIRKWKLTQIFLEQRYYHVNLLWLNNLPLQSCDLADAAVW